MSPSGLLVWASLLLLVSLILSPCILELTLAKPHQASKGCHCPTHSPTHSSSLYKHTFSKPFHGTQAPGGSLAFFWAFQSIYITFCGNSGISTSFITGHFFFHASKNILAAGPHHLLGHCLLRCWLLNNSIICVTTFCIKFPHSKYLEVFLFSWSDLSDSPFNISRLKLP